MGAEELNSSARSVYEYGFRRDAHQLLAWGYNDALPQLHRNLMEEEITGLIVEAIEIRLDSLSTPKKYDRYSIDEEKPIAVEGRKGKNRRRLDLVVVRHLRPRPKYIFEAKRLRKNGYSIGKYVGKEGLQCFIQGVYASQYPEAAMIGYIQSDNESYWKTKLEQSLCKDSQNNLCLMKPLTNVKNSPSIPDLWLSEHKRMKGSEIAIYHIFFNCSASPVPTIS